MNVFVLSCFTTLLICFIQNILISYISYGLWNILFNYLPPPPWKVQVLTLRLQIYKLSNGTGIRISTIL